MSDDTDTTTDERIDELETKLQEFKSAAQAAFQKAKAAEEEAAECAIAVEHLEADLEAAQQENQELRAELADVRDRTDLLQAVKQASALDSEEKAAVCIQTVANKAQRNDGKASLSPDEGLSALGNSIHRTSIYDVFDAAENLVDDTDVLKYKSESRSSDKNSRLILNLNEGTIPSTVAGQSIDGLGRCGSSTTRTTGDGAPTTASAGD